MSGARASGSKSPDLIFLGRVTAAIEVYRRVNKEQWPSNWDDLESCGLAASDDLRLRDRFALFSPPVPFSSISHRGELTGELVVASRRAFQEVSNTPRMYGGGGLYLTDPRHVIVVKIQSRGQELFPSVRLTESEMAAVYKGANIEPVQPDNLPERTWIVSARRMILVKRWIRWGALVTLLVAFALWMIMRNKFEKTGRKLLKFMMVEQTDAQRPRT